MAEQEEVAGVQAKRLAHLLDLVDKARCLPEFGYVGLAAAVRA